MQVTRQQGRDAEAPTFGQQQLACRERFHPGHHSGQLVQGQAPAQPPAAPLQHGGLDPVLQVRGRLTLTAGQVC